MSSFFAMNGYGFYIWSAYGVTALVVVIEVLALRSRRNSALADAELAAPDGARETTGAAR